MITIDEYTAQKAERDVKREAEMTDCYLRSAPAGSMLGTDLVIRKRDIAKQIERFEKAKRPGKS